MPREMQKKTEMKRVLKSAAIAFALFLLVAAGYMAYQACQILFPENTYEIALPATVSDTVEADGVLLFEESYLSGNGELGYLVEDGERVSAGTPVAEIYTDASQAALRQQLTELQAKIALLQKSQNVSTLQIDQLLRERAAAMYDLLDVLDRQEYGQTDEKSNSYLLEQNKLWIVTGDAADFTQQIREMTQQAQDVQSRLGSPEQITAPATGYFVRAAVSGRLAVGAEEILAMDAQQLQSYLDTEPELALDGCAGKLVSGFSWKYVGVCTAQQAEKLMGDNGKPLRTSVTISFPGRVENKLKATVSEIAIDPDNGLARFVLTCNTINGDVLRLNHASAQITVGDNTGLLVPASAVHYLKEDGTESETKGENYIPGVYVKFGNIARFCKIDPVDEEHPLIREGEYILVLPKGTDGSVSQVRIYDEIIVSGQNLYDGKLL